MYRNSDGELASAATGSELPLITPPQGGQILLVGPRARNLRGCHVVLATALVDDESGAVLTVDRRPIVLEPTAGDALAPKNPSGLSNYANVAACPVAGLTRPVNGTAYTLDMTVTDEAERSAQRWLQVIPSCMDGSTANACRCECSANFRQGASCGGGSGGSGGGS
ncbi:MAG TPA: hypothetical protein VG937_38210 [Polyangiaceae bacterium]|nr:hypothetical protein [Polyangiaceae bacterium]